MTDMAPSDDTAFYFATDAKTGELITSSGRLAYATVNEWDSIARTLPHDALIPTYAHGLPFGSVRLFDQGKGIDLVGMMIAAMPEAMRAAARGAAPMEPPADTSWIRFERGTGQ